MNLEYVETKAIAYLGQVENPLTPVSRLLAHLRRDEQCGDVQDDVLLAFLRKHPMVMVVEDPERNVAPGEAAELAELGIDTGPRVILNTRLPNRDELAAAIERQLKTMTDALYHALAEATESGDKDAQEKVNEILSRAEDLQKKIEGAL